MKKILYLAVISSIVLISCSKTNYNKISKEEYISKMKAAWIGQMIGVGWAAPTEFRFIGEIVPEKNIPEYDGNLINAFGQDDIYVEMTFIKTLENYGIDCSIRQAGIDFANSEYMLWGANEAARENLRLGIAPPESSHPEYNKGADWIDYQIEADFSGIICPGMPSEVVTLGEKFGRIMNYGDGLYGGQFMGGMYAAAYFEKDINKIINSGLACIPAESQYAECIRDVVEWHRKDPENWEKTWQLIEDKYRNNPEYQKYKSVNKEYWVEMDAKLNGAYIVMGLLYGNGNADSTIIISMRCGRDSDCNPSSAAGVLFASLGMDDIDKKYYDMLDYETKFDYTDYNFVELVEVCTKLTEQFIRKSGGKIEEKNGQTYYYIPEINVFPSSLEQSWKPGLFDANNKFSQEEMEQIKYLSTKQFDPHITEWTPHYWKIYHAGKNTSSISTSWIGKDGVISTSLFKKSRGIMIYLNSFPLNEGKKYYLKFSVSHQDEGSWDLTVNINWKETIKETISSEITKNGWKEYKIDVSEFAGISLSVDLRQDYNGNKKSTAYWYNVNLIEE
ncbi:ADP-ribosylglycohydrolase family protein [Bacteroidota bacterium]